MIDSMDGYVAGLNYTYEHHPQLNPLRLPLSFLNAGLLAPPVATACELGFGYGLSANLYAAASATQWFGNDINSEHVRFAKELAAASGAPTQFFAEPFAEFCSRGDLPDFSFRFWQRLTNGEEARHNTLHIAINDIRGLIEGDRRHRGGRIKTKAGQFEQIRFTFGKTPAMVAANLPGAFMKQLGAPVIAEPGPHFPHLIQGGLRQFLDRRPTPEKSLIIRRYGNDGRLLKHDFRQPDMIRIGRHARQRPPRKYAAILVVPLKQKRREAGGERLGINFLSPWPRAFSFRPLFDFLFLLQHTPLHVYASCPCEFH